MARKYYETMPIRRTGRGTKRQDARDRRTRHSQGVPLPFLRSALAAIKAEELASDRVTADELYFGALRRLRRAEPLRGAEERELALVTAFRQWQIKLWAELGAP